MRRISNLLRVSGLFVVMTASLFLSGCREEQPKSKSESVVLTVDGTKIYLDEMMYHVTLAQLQGQLYASLVEDGQNYWEIVNKDGKTMAETTLDVAMENAVRYELFSQLALQEGYILTEEEQALCKDKTDNILLNIPTETLENNELSKEEIQSIQEKIALATRYYNDYLKELGINEEEIKETIDPKEYQQYDIQYIFATKQEQKAIEGILEAAKAKEDLTTLANEANLKAGYATFLKGEDYFGEETNLEDAIIGMQKDEISDLIETSKGFYIVKLTNNNSTSEYDAAVKNAIEQKVDELFTPKYESLKEEHKITINKKVWASVKL